MNKIISSIHVIFVLVAFSLCPVSTFGIDKPLNKPFSYQAIMESDEWEKCLSTKERMAMLNVPEYIFGKLHTDSLLDLCLDYPYNIDILLLYEDYYEGFRSKCLSKQIFKELLSRQDLSEILINKDREMMSGLDGVSRMSSREKGYYTFKFFLLNIILSQDLLLGQMDDWQKKMISSSFSQKEELSRQGNEVFTGIYAIPIAVFKGAYKSGNGIRQGSGLQHRSSSDYIPVTYYTPFKSIVPGAKQFIGQDEPLVVNWTIYIDMLYELYHAEMLGYPTKAFNSHGYAWGNPSLWIEDYGVDVFWNDGSYVEVPESLATHVFYVDGQHSAIRANSSRYISKWGDGILARHSPNLLPEEFCPTGMKKYYKKATLNCDLNGPSHICGSEIYSISNVPVGASVTWSFKDTLFNDLIQSGYPSDNQCRIDNSNGYSINDTLFATVGKNGQEIVTLKKYVFSHLPFSATYSQTPSAYNKYHFPYIPETNFSLGQTLYVNQDCSVDIQTENFLGMNISITNHNNLNGVSWQRINDEHIRLHVMYQRKNGRITVNASNSDGCDNFSFSLYFMYNNATPYALGVGMNDCILNLSLYSPGNDGIIQEYSSSLVGWDISVVKVSTGDVVHTQTGKTATLAISTKNWETGVYTIIAQKDGQTMSQKIVIK